MCLQFQDCDPKYVCVHNVCTSDLSAIVHIEDATVQDALETDASLDGPAAEGGFLQDTVPAVPDQGAAEASPLPDTSPPGEASRPADTSVTADASIAADTSPLGEASPASDANPPAADTGTRGD